MMYDAMGVVAFDRKNAVARDDALGKTIELSLSFLKDERDRCLELGIFPEDAAVPFDMLLGTIWKTAAIQAQDRAQRLHDLALVRLDLPARCLSLHDSMRRYFASQLAAPAPLHAVLADTWMQSSARLSRGYGLDHASFHITEAMTDLAQVVPRASQLLDLMTDDRYQGYLRQHGDPDVIDRHITTALDRSTLSPAPEAPGLIAALAVLRASYAAGGRNPKDIFNAARGGRIKEAEARLGLFEASPRWDTLARMLIAWLGPEERTEDAAALIETASKRCDCVELHTALDWVRLAPDGVPGGLRQISGGPDVRHISALLQRAGGAEAVRGLEPLDFEGMASGNDASGFIAERDGPDLVAFAKLNPGEHTSYLERYIDIHAANRYVRYRNRSLWALLGPVLQYPDAAWVRTILEGIVTAALTVAIVDFEEPLPLAVLAIEARAGNAAALAAIDEARRRLFADASALRPEAGITDSWSHLQRRAATLAEIHAVVLEQPMDAITLLELARHLPKGFAGFRALSALTLAESTQLTAPANQEWIEAALLSARAASHRIQDHLFCLQTTAMVNAIRMHWADMTNMDLEAIVERFTAAPLADEFCSVHRVFEEFEYRTKEHVHQALPIPPAVQSAATIADIAKIFEQHPRDVLAVNGWVWGEPDAALVERLKKDDPVSIPDPHFVPILAARLSAGIVASTILPDDRRLALLQRLVPLTMPNRTALNTILARLLMASRTRPAPLPAVLTRLTIPDSSNPAGGAESIVA